MVNGFEPSALVAGDSFFAMINRDTSCRGCPSRAVRHRHHRAAAAAAGRLTDICSVVYAGVLAPWLLPTFVRATGLRQIHYVILLPPLEVWLERVQLRVDHGFSDRSVTRDLYEQFAKTAFDTRYLITEPGDHPAGLAELITRRLDDGQFRYSAF